MRGFEILEHTADVGVLATGDTLDEALSLVAKGMFSVIANLDTVSPTTPMDVTVDSIDRGALVVDWLNELLYLFEAEDFLPKEFDVSVNEGGASLVARCFGEKLDLERHTMLTSVKAATYHDLEVSHNDEWRIQVILDV